MSQRKFTIKDWYDQHFARVEAYLSDVNKAFRKALDEAVRLAIELRIDPNDLFSFDDYPQASERIDRIIRQLTFDLLLVIRTAAKSQWLFANQKNDALVGSVLAGLSLPATVISRYLSQNLSALEAYQQRVIGGKTLADRVRGIASQFKREIELGIDIGYGTQTSAQQLSKLIRADLTEPERLFRRVRAKHGNLVQSKAAAQYHPGTGNYRSSYKNALRLARTEINDSFRSADYERYQQLEFVVGIEIRRSNNPYPCKLCDAIKGVYPKTFVFRGNHPACRCVAIPILANRDELRTLNDMVAQGLDTSGFVSVNRIKEPQENFGKYIRENKERLLGLKSLPNAFAENLGHYQMYL